jgi:hypothetical protein
MRCSMKRMVWPVAAMPLSASHIGSIQSSPAIPLNIAIQPPVMHFLSYPFSFESHDHRRFINEFGELGLRDLLGEAYGDRGRFFKMQPFIIALYTGKGIPMLWNGQ